jgi:sugar transferase (PEP-CTERM/EpsH1 system associated)
MNILYIAHCIPYPPNKGEKIRAFHQIRYLAREHSVHLACLIDAQEEIEHVEALEQYCASVEVVYRDKRVTRFLAALALLAGNPFSVASFYSRRLKKKIAQKLRSEKFDIILVFSSAMAGYVRHVSTSPKVMDFVDVDSELWRLYADYHPIPLSWIYRLEAERLARYEEEAARIFDYSVFVSEKEADLFRQRVNDRPVTVVPNGIDLDYFAPSEGEFPHAGPPVVVFIGTMDYFPNVDAVRYFCQEIFPLVRQCLSEVHFYIVGRNPTRPVKKLGRKPRVTVTGSVSDVRPYLARAGAMVAPFRLARGIQNKILEAMAFGVPVVGTSTAFQGLEKAEMDGVRVADDPEKFAQELIALLKDPGWRRQCVDQARDYVQRYHQWQDHGAHLCRLLWEIAERPAARDE